MAEMVQAQQPEQPKREPPQAFAPFAYSWQRISPRLVPVLAVVTALIVTVPFMIITGGEGSISRGLQISGRAYSALIEGSLGLAVNANAQQSDFDLALVVAENENLEPRAVSSLARSISRLTPKDVIELERLGEVLARYEDDLDDEALIALGSRIPAIEAVGQETLSAMRPLIVDLADADRGAVRDVAGQVVAAGAIDADMRDAIEALAPSAAEISDDDLFAYMQVVDDRGIVALTRMVEQLDVLVTLSLAPDSFDAQDIVLIAEQEPDNIRENLDFVRIVNESGATTPVQLSNQLRLVDNLYSAGLLTGDHVATDLRDNLEAVLSNNLIIKRPGNRILVDERVQRSGIINNEMNTPDDPTDDVPEAAYLRLGNHAFIFFPSLFEFMVRRAIPFVIAGLAVALGFKAGLFNIGAEGQLFAAGTVAAWLGFTPLLDGLPGVIHIPIVIIGGIFGGFVWGAIPGFLKAYTGAHEVINTIMMNFIAIRLVDWLIKSTDPLILLDTEASTPRTPFLVDSAQLPAFHSIGVPWIVVSAIVVLIYGLWRRQEQIQQQVGAAIRPIINGLLVLGFGLFLHWTTARGELHIGLLLMLGAVWFTGWFLDRTTLGFELRTVGANADAARYAGMSVPRNIIMAMALSGALAGLAGAIEISGVQHNMQPEFFAGLGFDAIAVALLARNDPRNMIPAGFLWGILLAGANLMQVRADIAIELVNIIQALIIMFVAADAIIRFIYRVPEATAEEKAKEMRLSSWGG